MENEEKKEAAGGGPNLDDPAVKAAIQQAVAAAVAAATKPLDDEKKSILANRDEILQEKKKLEESLKPLGGLQGVLQKVKEAEERDAELAAQGLGADPKKFSEEVDRRAQLKFEAKQAELAEVTKADKTKITELETKVKDLDREVMLSFAAKELVLGAMPEDFKFVHDGAWNHLIGEVSGIIERKQVDGLPFPVARFKSNGAYMPGSGPDGLMTPREFLEQTRAGKGPFGHLQYCFVSKGKGSGTETNDVAGGPNKPFKSMTEDEKLAFSAKDPDGYKKAVDAHNAARFSKSKEAAA